MRPVKNLLVYADGRVEDAGYELVGAFFIKPEMVDGDRWVREFEIHLACNRAVAYEKADPKTMVAVERSFKLQETSAEIAKRDAARRARVERECLWGIANYPADKG